MAPGSRPRRRRRTRGRRPRPGCLRRAQRSPPGRRSRRARSPPSIRSAPRARCVCVARRRRRVGRGGCFGRHVGQGLAQHCRRPLGRAEHRPQQVDAVQHLGADLGWRRLRRHLADEQHGFRLFLAPERALPAPVDVRGDLAQPPVGVGFVLAGDQLLHVLAAGTGQPGDQQGAQLALRLLVEVAYERSGVRGRNAERVRQRPVVERLPGVQVQQDPLLAREPRHRLPHDGAGAVWSAALPVAPSNSACSSTPTRMSRREQLLARQREQPRLELLGPPQPVQLERLPARTCPPWRRTQLRGHAAPRCTGRTGGRRSRRRSERAPRSPDRADRRVLHPSASWPQRRGASRLVASGAVAAHSG